MRAPIVVAVALAAIISGRTLAEEGYVVGITGALTGAGQNAMPPPMLLRGPFGSIRCARRISISAIECQFAEVCGTPKQTAAATAHG